MAKRGREPTVFLPWETKSPWAPRFALRRVRTVVLLALALGLCVVLVRVDRWRRAVFVTRVAVDEAQRALEAWRSDHEGRCPGDWSALLLPSEGREPYLAHLPRDGWENPLRLRCPGRKNPHSADVASPGPTGRFESLEQSD